MTAMKSRRVATAATLWSRWAALIDGMQGQSHEGRLNQCKLWSSRMDLLCPRHLHGLLCHATGSSAGNVTVYSLPGLKLHDLHDREVWLQVRGERNAFERALRDLSSILRSQGQDRPCDLVSSQTPCAVLPVMQAEAIARSSTRTARDLVDRPQIPTGSALEVKHCRGIPDLASCCSI